MEHHTSTLERLLEKVEQYSKTTLELVRLKSIYKASEILSAWVVKVLIVLIVVVFLLMFNIGLALFISDQMGRLYAGFGVVAAFYLLLAMVLYRYRTQWIQNPIHRYIINQLLEEFK